MQEFYVIPTIGQFKATITPTFHPYEKDKLMFQVLNVGGNTDKCVNITIYPEGSSKEKEANLSWTEVIDKECTVNSQVIKGDKTTEMLRLAFTLLREVAPHVEYIILRDMSFFICKTPDGQRKVGLPPYYIAFYGKTWYEDKFGAELVNKEDREKYKKYIQNLYNKENKPPFFNFIHPTISELLLPEFVKSETWDDFFKFIAKQYPNEKCALVHPWIEYAISTVFESSGIYAGQEWIIYLDKIPNVHYYELEKSKIRGGFNKKYEHQSYHHRDIEYNNILRWDIHKFIKKNKRKYTRKYKTSRGTRKSKPMW